MRRLALVSLARLEVPAVLAFKDAADNIPITMEQVDASIRGFQIDPEARQNGAHLSSDDTLLRLMALKADRKRAIAERGPIDARDRILETGLFADKKKTIHCPAVSEPGRETLLVRVYNYQVIKAMDDRLSCKRDDLIERHLGIVLGYVEQTEHMTRVKQGLEKTIGEADRLSIREQIVPMYTCG